MILADSNLIIYAASGKYPKLVEWFAENKPVTSAISLVEVLGYHKLKANEKSVLENLFAELNVIYPSVEVFQKAIELRQQRNVSVSDALIAATAIAHDLTFATHNVSDFDWIESLKLIDPLEEMV
ncbi:MAG: type II toxin-antitoxin system VapC family toxin [Chloroflexi bacterium]|nr:type II toxin-antitoxin system VapC family toxin [Chloroflexota bacterium]